MATWLDEAEKRAREAMEPRRCDDCGRLRADDVLGKTAEEVPEGERDDLCWCWQGDLDDHSTVVRERALATDVLTFRQRAIDAMASAWWEASRIADPSEPPWHATTAKDRSMAEKRIDWLLAGNYDRSDPPFVPGDAAAVAVGRALGLIEERG